MELSSSIALSRDAGAGLLRKAALRFVSVYAVLYFFPTPLGGTLPGTHWLEKGWGAAGRSIGTWVGVHLFSLPTDFPQPGGGSGDTTLDFINTLCLLAATLALTAASFALPNAAWTNGSGWASRACGCATRSPAS
jgi:hypothetical protein